MGKKYKDIEIGDVYGRWTVIDKGKTIIGHNFKQYWICQCLCENHTIREVNGETLKNGKSTSCGCITKEKALISGEKIAYDLTGQRFGKLVAQYFIGH
jgi:hypothetical protein